MQIVSEHELNPSTTEIALRAYQIWQAEGQPAGQAVKHWLEAETELMAAQLRSFAAGQFSETKTASQRTRYGLVLQGDSPRSRRKQPSK